MSDEPRPGPRRQAPPPLMDRLGELCKSGRDSATYLWQVPDDESVRRKIAAILAEIKVEAAKGGRQEMGRVVGELETALLPRPAPSRWKYCRTDLTGSPDSGLPPRVVCSSDSSAPRLRLPAMR